MYRNTYKSLSDENPFIYALGTNQTIVSNGIAQNLKTTEAKEVFFSIKNVLGKDEFCMNYIEAWRNGKL